MCGIAGYAGPTPLDPDRIAATLPLMRHRGPDDQSHHAFQTPAGRHVHLLHSRLTIIDLDPRSNQPFHAGSTWLDYNGELYNYKELAAAMSDLRTRSDTEVMTRVLDRDGWGGLDACEGMWAFAAYDERTGELGLARDRFGEKPLYVLRDGDSLYWGSEPKFVWALAGVKPRPNERQLMRLLVNGYKSLYKSGETWFEGLDEVDAGTVLTIDADGRQDVRRYWSPPVPSPDESMSFEDAVAGTRERLIRSVELRLRADVPLAFCMSGGVDSLALISIAKRELDYDVHGFTILNTDARYDEQDIVDDAVRELALRHTSVTPDTHEFLPRLRGLVRQHDGPVATISYYVHWLLMGAIHGGGYRVSVSGTAADELYSGYYDHHLAYLAETGDAEARAAWEQHVKPMVRNPFLSDPLLFKREPDFRDHIYLDADVFASWLEKPFAEPFSERDFGAGLLRGRMLNELFAESVPVILHEDDLNAMSFSIENRSPYLDRALFEHALTIPVRHLVRDGRAKAVLRDAMRGIAPARAMENRRKVGFNAPIDALLDRRDPAVRAQVLEDSPVWDLVRRDAVEAILDLEELPNSRSKFLFNVLCTKFFLEEYA